MTRIDRESHLESLVADISRRMSELGVSQAELSRRTEMDPASISKLLKMQVDPRVSTLLAILKALDCEMSVLAHSP